MERLNIRQKMSTAFHPQTDRQTEWVNRTLEQYHRIFCTFHQDNCIHLLPMTEFAYNNSATSVTKISPFYANYGYNSQTNWPSETPAQNPSASNYVMWLQKLHEHSRTQLIRTWDERAKHADTSRLPSPLFKVGDKVMFDSRNI